MTLAAFFHMVFVFWVVMDAPGNIPIFVSMLSSFDPKKQRQIILREMCIALFIMLVFLFFGEAFFSLLKIDADSLQIAGGIIIFLIALRLLFATAASKNGQKLQKEPFIVPLAVPMIAGPGILATISLYSGGLAGTLPIFLGVVLAWALSVPFLLLGSFLKKILGDNGLCALERLFGYVLALIAVQMTVGGLTHAFKT